MGYSICPVCHQDDAVVSVAQAINSGTTTQNFDGFSYSPVTADGISISSFSSTMQTRLASVLTPPTKPASALYIGFFILGGIIWGMWHSTTTSPDIAALWRAGFISGIFGFILSFLAGFFPGLIAGVGAYLAWVLLAIPFRIRHKHLTETLMSSSYCFRDDVVYGDDNRTYSPDEYVHTVFS